MKTQISLFYLLASATILISCRLSSNEGKNDHNQLDKEEFIIEKYSSPEISNPKKVFKAFEPLFKRTFFQLDPAAIKEYNDNGELKILSESVFYVKEGFLNNCLYFPGLYYYKSDEILDIEVEFELASNYHKNQHFFNIYLEVENNYKVIYRLPIAREENIGEFKDNVPITFKKYNIKISDLPYAYYLMPKVFAKINSLKDIEIYIKNISYKITPRKKVTKHDEN